MNTNIYRSFEEIRFNELTENQRATMLHLAVQAGLDPAEIWKGWLYPPGIFLPEEVVVAVNTAAEQGRVLGGEFPVYIDRYMQQLAADCMSKGPDAFRWPFSQKVRELYGPIVPTIESRWGLRKMMVNNHLSTTDLGRFDPDAWEDPYENSAIAEWLYMQINLAENTNYLTGKVRDWLYSQVKVGKCVYVATRALRKKFCTNCRTELGDWSPDEQEDTETWYQTLIRDLCADCIATLYDPYRQSGPCRYCGEDTGQKLDLPNWKANPWDWFCHKGECFDSAAGRDPLSGIEQSYDDWPDYDLPDVDVGEEMRLTQE